jgi:ankyrin repeat protein
MELEKKTSNLILKDEKLQKKSHHYSNEIHNKSHKTLISFENIKKNEEKNLNEYLSLLLNKNNQINNEENILTFLVTSQYNKSKKIFNDFMFKCCELNKEKFLNILLNCGCDINCQNEKGETLFHYAISKNNIKIIKLLIQYNPNKNIKTKNNLTIYDYAKKVKNPLILSLITEKKFEPKTNFNNNTFYFDDKYNFTLAKFHSKKNDIKINETQKNDFPLTRRNTNNTYFSSFIKSKLLYDNP